MTTREDIVALYEEKLTLKEFLYVSQFRTDIYQNLDVEKKDKKYFDWGVLPAFRTFLNSSTGFFQYRLGVTEYVKFNPWKGSMLMLAMEQYPINNMTWNGQATAQAVRSDFIFYTFEKNLMDKLLADQMVKLPNEVYARAAFGYLETEYAGLDWEVAKPLWGGRVMNAHPHPVASPFSS